MNKWIAKSIISYVEIKEWDTINQRTGNPNRSASWTMTNEIGKARNFYNCRTYNENIIDILKDGIEIELTNYDIRVNTYKDKNTLENKKFVYFQVQGIMVHNSDPIEASGVEFANKDKQAIPNDYKPVDENSTVDDLVDYDWSKKLAQDNANKLEEYVNEALKEVAEEKSLPDKDNSFAFLDDLEIIDDEN